MTEAKARRWWSVFRVALKKFWKIDGPHRAGAFAYYAFFSLFPLIILVVSLASRFIDRAKAGEQAITLLQRFVPLSDEMQLHIVETIGGVARTRGAAGVVAVLMLIWVALQFLTILISATNRAWETEDPHWWRVPLKSLGLLVILIGMALLEMVALVRRALHWILPAAPVVPSWLHSFGSFISPLIMLFISLALFYKFTPSRPVRMAHVWLGPSQPPFF